MKNECMVIIKKSALNTFGTKYPDAIPALNEWYAKAKAADWRNHAELKTTFLSADYIRKRTVCFQYKRKSLQDRCKDSIFFKNTLH